MDFVQAILVFLLGLGVGVPASMVGIGGGVIIVPALIVLFELPANNAIAISLVAILGTTVSATIGYIRHKQIDYKLGLLYDVMDVPGIVLGAYITTFLPHNLLAGICGIFILVIAYIMFRDKRKRSHCPSQTCETDNKKWTRNGVDHKGNNITYHLKSRSMALLSSFAGGIITGLAGLGGGVTDVTSMILLGVPTHIAVATSEFAMAITNGVGVVTHGLLNNLMLDYAIPITIGTIIGAQVGCLLARRVHSKHLRTILFGIATLAGIRLVLQFFMP
jgi:uncharacterized membrane protein YfcA